MKTRKLPDRADLLLNLNYNPETGVLIRIRTGNVATYVMSAGYLFVKYAKQNYLAHRIIWKIVYGYDPIQIDHINRNKQDNRICNLREVNTSQNNCNTSRYKNNTSGHKGVVWSKNDNLWKAQLWVEGKCCWKYCKTKEEAIEVIKSLREKYHGEYAHH
jgi:hypothetical protein